MQISLPYRCLFITLSALLQVFLPDYQVEVLIRISAEPVDPLKVTLISHLLRAIWNTV
jgi:hypothetical protein